MTLSMRRASARAEAESAPAHLQRAIDPESDPDLGFFRRKAARLRRLGIKPIGPNGPPAEPPEPPPEHAAAIAGEHRVAVQIELAEIDQHRKAVEARLAAIAARGADNFEQQELRAELRALGTLRAEIEGDLSRPTARDRSGRPLTDEIRAFIRARTAELREQSWHAAERHSRAGEHREARRSRVDALRARHVAEHELGLRSSLPGYTTMWS